ncbi:hybrid sensor histidine kinase/response regulator [Prosthecomicrobium pneumaticum]|uniref:histidine kinase n=1 Tax=Prosthecomicrobium pneumaticum TaxID=81895 RepID=A0A7W9CUX8_9HYPH|nr:ATP-binding protein [Prosthecomicrobium pneumaticum]MBB5752345.1 signal transduction histidine kinase/DNA-binding NarL/FixJ family response regulator [Prosthecomicrobium pneumaticum]
MAGRQRIVPVRREYNRWVANQTLEDYALRFTAKSARRWSTPRVAQTAIGAISFLALEAIGGTITLSHGFANALAATLVAGVVLFLTGLPIARYASRYGVDIDLLTRGAGFGYIGSTITSLIYATFTFILFAIEASIMTTALELAFGVPDWLGYIVSAVVVIPLVTHGFAGISRFQIFTQPLWIGLNVLPVGFILWQDWGSLDAWFAFEGLAGAKPLDLVSFGSACSVILALMPQIGEQVDMLRFRPPRSAGGRGRVAALLAGAGWIVVGAPKLLFGSFLAVLALRHAVPAEHAAEPAYMYAVAFGYVLPWQDAVLFLTAAFVVVSQLKINVMNAYAGSLAWSNFFSRLTHSHPGRVVWLVFNVVIALLLMELGIYHVLEQTLGLFSVVAVAWLGAIVADLAINKPLGLAPPGIEFKRAHLYDVNPVGTGAMGIAAAIALAASFGAFGVTAQALAPFVALGVALVTAPAIAYATKGRYYLARKPRAQWASMRTLTCSICEHDFEPEDMAYCPAYAGPICSLCCSLDARCHDLCKPHAKFETQVNGAIATLLPARLKERISPRLVRYFGVLAVFVAVIILVLMLIRVQADGFSTENQAVIGQTLWAAFFVLLIVAGVAAWFLVLAQESRRVAQEESARQTTLLLREIAAHRRTDAALQKAKEAAEAANDAKSRYLVGLSHELRTPLNAVFGYAQILERDPELPEKRQGSVRVIRRSAEHLSGLIDGLLEISKIEAGRLQLQRNEVRLTDFLDQIVEMMRFQAEAKGLGFEFHRPAHLPEVVTTDDKRLRQILVNLLSNAIKFTERGTVSLTIRYRSQVATIAVADTGPGIPEDELERIFEPFERGRGTGATVPGTGLGLTITKMLAQLMGGDITVKSTPGRGSLFEVRLMLSAIERPHAVLPAKRILGYQGPRRTILCVDDDADHRALVREVLEPVGFTVLLAADGPSALALAETLEPDLFLLDISMPGMNGYALARALRATGHPGRIVMLSANVGETAPSEAEAPAHDDTLAKPFDVSQLLDRVQSLLGLAWIDESAPDRFGPPRPAGIRLKSPGPEHVAELLRLGRIGYVRGIEAKLDQLDADEENRPFVDALRTHLKSFDFRRLTEVLEGLRGHG